MTSPPPVDPASIERLHPAPSVGIRPVWAAVVDIAPREDLGGGPHGERFIVPIQGGVFWGAPGFEAFHGRVRPGGADRQTLRADGVKELDAFYEIETHDGAVITVRNRVVLDDSRGPERYARSTIRLTAPPGPHAWLNRRIFIGTLQVLRPVREAVLIRGHLVD